MITLKEIADLAGVSRGTVDRVLKKRAGVSQTVVERVNAIIHHYGYTPNRAAQALVHRKKEYRIGVISSSTQNPFFKDVMQGIESAKKEIQGLGVSLCYREVPKFDPDAQLEALEATMAENIDGLAIRPINDEKIRKKLQDVGTRIPMITFNTELDGVNELAHVGSDFRKTGKIAAGLMAGLCGEEARIVVALGTRKSYGPSMMADEFGKELAAYPGMSVATTIEMLNDEILSYSKISEYLRSDRAVTAFFFASGSKEGGIRAIQEAALPHRVTIITLNIDPFTRACLESGVVAATICDQPFIQGYEPVRQLANHVLYGEVPTERFQYTNPEILVRQCL